MDLDELNLTYLVTDFYERVQFDAAWLNLKETVGPWQRRELLWGLF